MLETSKKASQRPQDIPSRQQHAKTLETLDHAHHDTNKSIVKLQAELNVALGRISRAKDERTTWELKDPVGEHEVDALP
jgi:hypothetical protein